MDYINLTADVFAEINLEGILPLHFRTRISGVEIEA